MGKAQEDQSHNKGYIQSLLMQHQDTMLKLWVSIVSKYPLWTYSLTEIDSLTEIRKCSRTEVEMHTDILAHLAEHPAEHIYSDELKTDQHLGFAVVYQTNTYSGRLLSETSIFAAKTYTRRTVLTKILGVSGGK